MAVVLGYGGIANTNGARDYSGKTEAAAAVAISGMNPRAVIAGRQRIRSRWYPVMAPLTALLRMVS